MKKNDKILLIVFIAVFLLITAIGLSYAYYTAVIDNGEESSSIVSRSGNLELTYTDGVKQIIGADIYPGWQDTKTFTVKNTGNGLTAYSIKVTDITNKFTIANSISLSLKSSDGGKNMGKKTLPSSEATIVKYVSIDVGDTHTYTVTTYYNNLDVDQSADKGKSFSYTIEVDAAIGTGGDILIAQNDTNSLIAKVFNGPITKKQVASITFKNTNAVPSNAVASWDVSEAQNGSIMAYTLSNGALYDLYIGQEGGVTLGEDASNMFSWYKEVTTINLNNIDTSNTTNMASMFSNIKATTLDLSSFDTSNVTDMSFMFDSISATNLDLSSFDTTNVTNMEGMFYYCKATNLDLRNFNTSNVTDMSYMFDGSDATTLNLSSFDTSKVTDMSYMFESSHATTLDLSSFDTSKVTSMSYMFSYSYATTGYARTQADADKFNDSSVTGIATTLLFTVK